MRVCWRRLKLLFCLQVAPKRAALAAAQETLDKTLSDLASAQARLAAVQEKIATLEAQYEEATTKKATLAAQVQCLHALLSLLSGSTGTQAYPGIVCRLDVMTHPF